MTVRDLISELERFAADTPVALEYFAIKADGEQGSFSEPIDTVFVQPSYKPNAGMLILSNWLDPIPSR